jgi:hypothetical protein
LPPSQVTLDDIVEEKHIVEGVHDVAGSMFNEMYQSLFKGKKTYELLRDVVLSRLVYPCSKRRTDLSLLVSKFASKTAIIPGMSAGTAASTVKLLILECVLIALFPTRDITDNLPILRFY